MNETASRALFRDQTDGMTTQLFSLRGWLVHSKNYPVLDIAFVAEGWPTLRVQMVCDRWNELPPSIRLLDSEGTPLHSTPRGPGGVFNPSAHPRTGLPFICMRGSQEYHTHPSHLNDDWSCYRGQSSYDLGGILTQIWQVWKKAQP